MTFGPLEATAGLVIWPLVTRSLTPLVSPQSGTPEANIKKILNVNYNVKALF